MKSTYNHLPIFRKFLLDKKAASILGMALVFLVCSSLYSEFGIGAAFLGSIIVGLFMTILNVIGSLNDEEYEKLGTIFVCCFIGAVFFGSVFFIETFWSYKF